MRTASIIAWYIEKSYNGPFAPHFISIQNVVQNQKNPHHTPEKRITFFINWFKGQKLTINSNRNLHLWVNFICKLNQRCRFRFELIVSFWPLNQFIKKVIRFLGV